jgi:AsmA-like C-terminal region
MDAGSNKRTNLVETDSQAVRLRERDRVWEIRFVWFLLLTLVSLGTYHYLHSRVDDTLRGRILNLLAAQFPKHLVALDSAHLEPGRGILLEGLTIALPTPTGPRVVARVPRLVAQGDIQLIGLVQGDLPIIRVSLDAVDLSLWPMPDGRTSIESLSSPKPIPQNLPPIEIRRGLVRVSATSDADDQELILHDLNVSIRSNARKSTTGRVDGAIATNQVEQHSASDPFLESSVDVIATVSSSYFTKLHVQVALSNDKQSWNVRGEVRELFYTSQWVDRLPKQWSEGLAQLNGFNGHIGAQFGIEKKDRNELVQYSFIGQIQNGRLQHPKLPYPLEDLAGTLHYRNQLLQLRQATARSGQATFRLEADVHGLAVGSPMVAQLHAKNLPLDERLLRAIPRPIQEQWIKLNLAGVVDTELTLQYDGIRWTPEIVVHARNGSVNADIFPYPLTQVQGDFHYRDGILISDAMTAMAGGKVIRGVLRLARASPRWLVDFSVSSDSPVPIDETLIQALTPRGEPPNSLQNFVHSLAPRGAVHIEQCRFVRNADDIHSISKSIELSIYGGALRYSGFRYPMVEVQGHISVENQTIRLQRMKGRNDSARIQCEGKVECQGNRLTDLELGFAVLNLPLDEELHSSLPESVRNLWSHLRPSGVVDHVDVKLAQHGADQPLEVDVRLQEDGKDDAVAGRSVSMLPLSLPYLLNNVSCDLRFRPGVVELLRFGASHDLSRVAAQGDFQVRQDGTWNGILTWLPTTRLNVDQSLLVSLPEYMRAPLMATEFRGPMGITGQTLVASNNATGEPSVQAWDIALEVEDGQLARGSLATGIRGSLHILGENSDHGPVAKGYMTIDALAVRGIPVTNLTGPFAISDSKLFVGRLAKSIDVAPLATRLASYRSSTSIALASATLPAANKHPNAVSLDHPIPLGARSNELPILDVRDDDLKAKALSGTMYAYGSHPLIEGQTELKLALADADLAGFLGDLGENHESTSGRLWIEGRLAGSLMHANTLSGSGNAWLRQANFYQMPVMTRMFRVLSVKPPEDGAFESADVQFRLDGDRIPIDRISLDGDIISLRGDGWTNLRREIQLDLYAYVGNRSPMAVVFGPLISQNDNATMLQLEVTGTTDKMEFRRNIPLMGTSLQQIFPERVATPNTTYR